MPGTNSLRESGVQVHSSTQDEPGEEFPARKMAETLSGTGKSKDEAEPSTQAMVITGTGLPALPKKLVNKILANEYMDFAELPPAKGKARNVPQSLEGKVLVVQAADMMNARKIIPDLATWVQCFNLYVATLASHQPHRIGELMAYESIIARGGSPSKNGCEASVSQYSSQSGR